MSVPPNASKLPANFIQHADSTMDHLTGLFDLICDRSFLAFTISDDENGALKTRMARELSGLRDKILTRLYVLEILAMTRERPVGLRQ